MEIYLGKDPDSSEALEFLCLAEAGGITHYEILNGMTSELKNEKFSIDVQRILAEKKSHQQTYTELAKQKRMVLDNKIDLRPVISSSLFFGSL